MGLILNTVVLVVLSAIVVSGTMMNIDDDATDNPTGYCRRKNLLCPGRDIMHRGGQTESSCRKLCNANTECQSVQFRRDGNCWLKRYICDGHELHPRMNDVDLIRKSAIKVGGCELYTPNPRRFCAREHHYCDGATLHSRHPTPNRAICEYWCLFSRDCVSYEWKTDLLCVLKRDMCSNDRLVPNFISSDYVKQDYGASCAKFRPNWKFCVMKGKDCPGDEIEHRGGIYKEKDCHELCRYSWRCNSLVWKVDGNCHLKSKCHSTNAYTNVNTAFRVGPKEKCPKGSKKV